VSTSPGTQAGQPQRAVTPPAGPARPSPDGRRSVTLLVLGQGASTIGDGCYTVALAWYILASRGSTGLLGVTLVAYGLARAAAMPAGGALADRLGPRQVLLAVDAIRCLLLAAMTAMALSGPATPGRLVPIAVLIGACNGAFTPGSYALVPSLADSRLQAANAMLTGATQLGALLGPVAGAALVTQAGPASAFAVDAATFAVSALTLALIRRPPPPAAAEPAPPPPGLRQVLSGAPALPTMLTVVLAGNIAAAGIFAVALPVLAHDRFGTGGYGAVLAALAAGAVAGTVLGAAAKTTRPAVFASAGFLVQAAALAVIPYAGGAAAAAACAVLFGLANSVGELVIVTAVQRAFPPAALGRVMGLIMLASAGAFPLSVAFTTFVVSHLGTAAAFPVAGGLSASAIAWGLSRRHYRDFGRTATARGRSGAR
jgi:predicted MFS family arabinose efflux permease